MARVKQNKRFKIGDWVWVDRKLVQKRVYKRRGYGTKNVWHLSPVWAFGRITGAGSRHIRQLKKKSPYKHFHYADEKFHPEVVWKVRLGMSNKEIEVLDDQVASVKDLKKNAREGQELDLPKEFPWEAKIADEGDLLTAVGEIQVDEEKDKAK